MGGCNLTEVEMMYLTEFSYIDLPEQYVKDKLTFHQIIEKLDTDVILKDNERKKLDSIKGYLKDNEDSNLGKLTLIDYQNNNPTNKPTNPSSNKTSDSGFVGYAFIDSNDNGITVFRGSESSDGDRKKNEKEDYDNFKADWGLDGNIGAGLGHDIKQQQEALEFYDKNMKNIKGNKHIIGHSKGGNLTEYVMSERFDRDSCDVYGTTFNGAPYSPVKVNLTAMATLEFIFSGEMLEDAEQLAKTYNALTHPNYVAISVDGDPVSLLGQSYFFRNTKVIEHNEGFAHSMESAVIKNGEFVTIRSNFSNINKANFSSNFSDVSKLFLSNFKNRFQNISEIAKLMIEYSRHLSKEKINNIEASTYKGSDYGELIVDLDELSYYSKRLSLIKSQADSLGWRLNSIIEQHNLVELKNQYYSVTQNNSKLNKSVQYIDKTVKLVNQADTAVYNLSKKF